MATTDLEALADDLHHRTKIALIAIARLAIDTGITFTIGDVVERVEDDLPPDYPETSTIVPSRRDVISEMAYEIFKGKPFDG
ncbi:hypothetical protein ACIQOU_32905 [Streptomyces sp. NPDC091279]|uniref:hypothetical protein n=1 Tax=unclassified Streptomyces TaxID=2593676 RepID=UPI00381D39C2